MHRHSESQMLRQQHEIRTLATELATARHDEERDLGGRADGNSQREFHLVLCCENDRRRVFSRVPHDGDDDSAEEEVGHLRDDGTDGIHGEEEVADLEANHHKEEHGE